MDLGLENKVIVVAGDTDAVGEGIVRGLSNERAIAVLVGRNELHSQKLAKEINLKGGNAFSVKYAFGESDACEKAMQMVVQQFGQIDGLVNNEIAIDPFELYPAIKEGFIKNRHDGLSHYYLMTHFALPYLIKTKGAIVNIISDTAARSGDDSSEFTAMNGGCSGLTREWAVELLKYGIRCNAVIKSKSGNRITVPEEIGNAAAFLLSGKSSHTTGQLIHVGGH